MQIIGLTGMSGAGKTTVCEIFKENGFYIIDCDKLAREVVTAGSHCLREISERFSSKYILDDGNLDRRKMAELIFSDNEKRCLLNKTIYPYISYCVIKKLNECEINGQEYVLLDAPTLFESGINCICNAIVSVVCNFDISLKRIIQRDCIDEKLARNRLLSQNEKEFYSVRSDFCIENNGSVDELKKRTIQVVGTIIKKVDL